MLAYPIDLNAQIHSLALCVYVFKCDATTKLCSVCTIYIGVKFNAFLSIRILHAVHFCIILNKFSTYKRHSSLFGCLYL